MAALSNARIAELLEPFYPDLSPEVTNQLSVYLDLLLRWNARTNLTAIRDPEEIVRRHFGESLFTAAHLPPAESLLDLGSGAGFPGIPIQLAMPGLRVTLAESRNKKAAFLHEVVRTLALPTHVWSQRADILPAGTLFDVVTLRAVDNPAEAIRQARSLTRPGGVIAHLTSAVDGNQSQVFRLPGSKSSVLHLMP